METAVSLGSNMGERLAALRAARDRIAKLPKTQLIAQAPVYETEPVGVKPEYANLFFLNTVLVYETGLALDDWFDALQSIEIELGRLRSADRYAPRTIDIDLLYYGDQQCAEHELIVPHEHWSTRRFVVQPLADLRPDLVLPGDTRTVKEILASLPARPTVKLLTKEW